MGVYYCCVRGCSSDTTLTNAISFFKFPKDHERRLTWIKNCEREDLENLTLHSFPKHQKVCSLHFESEMFTSLMRNRLRKNAAPTIFNVHLENQQANALDLKSPSLPLASSRLSTNFEITSAMKVEPSTCSVDVGTFSSRFEESGELRTRQCVTVNNAENVRCRTCLEIVNTKQSMEVTRKCYLDKTIKHTILIFVPEMVSTLFDWDVICKTCYGILKSSLQFIKRCLEVEFTIAAENKGLEYPLIDSLDRVSELKDNLGDSAIFYVDTDHNYYCTNDVEAVPVTISPTSSKDSENSCQHNGPTFYDSPSATDANEDLYEEAITIEYCDLLLESKVNNNSDSALCVSKASGEVKMSCETCSEKFSSDDYQLHLDIHPPFICHQCGKGFKTRRSYAAHLKIHNVDYRVLCDICGKSGIFSLKLHKATHRKERPYMCHKCPKTYKTKLACETHEKLIHKRVNQQQCHECGRTFLTLSKCQMHYRLKHLKLTPFVCNVCGEKFGRKDYLQRHMQRHTSESEPWRRGRVSTLGFISKHTGKPVTCKICGKKIASLNTLRKHLLTHTKMNRYKCRYCSLLFTRSSNRDRHEKNNHNDNSEHKFRCNICWKRMKTEEELEVHLLVHKKRPPRYGCDTCGKQFHKSYLLYNHRMEEHVSPEDIEEAEREIVTKNLLEYAQTSSINKVG